MPTHRSVQRTALLATVIALAAALATTSLLLGATPPSSAQATVVLVDRFDAAPSGARAQSPRAVVIRRASGEGPQNFILVTSATRPDDLDKAVSQLSVSLRRTPRIQGNELRAFIAPARANPAGGRDRARASRDLARLAGAREKEIPGIGRGKAVVVRLKLAPSK